MKYEAYIEPWFSFLDAADNERGTETIPEKLVINGRTVDGLRWLAQDIYDRTGTPMWPERGGRVDGLMTAQAAFGGYSYGAALSGAGDLVDEYVVSPPPGWKSPTPSTAWDVGTDDFVQLVFGYQATGTLQQIVGPPLANSVDLLCGSDMLGRMIGTWPARASNYIDHGADTDDRWWLSAYACDRDHASGWRGYDNGVDNGSPVNPTAYQGSMVSGNYIRFCSAWGTGSYYTGGLSAICQWHAGDWLDADDRTDLDNAIGRVVAQVYGRHFTTYRGDKGHPVMGGGRRNFTVEGVAYKGTADAHCIETETNGGDQTWITTSVQGEYVTICTDGSEIPQTGEITVEFWYKRGLGPGYNEPLFSFSDGTSAERFEIFCTTAGFILAETASASGSAGSALQYNDYVTGNVWNKISVCLEADRLLVVHNGVPKIVDTDVAVPTGLTTFRMAANYDVSVVAQQPRFKCGPGFGVQVYAAILY